MKENLSAQGQRELEQAAALGELARPLIHECGNFLNNLLLQLTIMDATATEGQDADVAALRQAALHLAKLLQEWRAFRLQAPAAATQPFCEVLADVLQDLRDEGHQPAPPHTPAEAATVAAAAPAVTVKRLLYLLLRHVYSVGPCSSITLEVLKHHQSIRLEIASQEPQWTHGLRDGADPALIMLACTALAQRLGGSVQPERDRQTLQLELPALA